jgi:RNA polymerase sigma-70 factor (ECF subfamily)
MSTIGLAPGAHADFAERAESHRRALELYCSRMLGSAEEAEHAVHETLLRAWRRRRSFRGRSPFRTWLFGIATHVCLETIARRERPEGTIADALQLVPPRERALLIARDVLGWSASDSAALLHMTVAAASAAVQRARLAVLQGV